MRIDLFVHFETDTGVCRLLEEILTLTRLIHQQGVHVMATITEVQAALTAAQASIAKESDLDNSIIALVQTLTGMVAAVKQQLADAIAAGGDPTALQAVVDGLTNIQTTADANAQKLADAVTANTPAA